MARLGDTVADLVRRTLPHSADSGNARLAEVTGFGANPGSLRMHLHAPPGLAAGSALVVVLHGCGQTAQGYAHGAGWLALADACGFAVLAPEQARGNNMNLCFNWFEPGDVARGAGEAASVAQMVDRAVADHALDPRRVFVTGLSAGGAMAAALLAAYPDVFAAGAIIAGLPYGAASGVQEAFGAMRNVRSLSAAAWGDKVRAAAPRGASAPPRVSVWQGDADTTVSAAAADALVAQWADVHGLTASEPASTASPLHRRRVWRGADGGVRVELNTLAGMGHGAPLAATGEGGWGEAGPWLLEVGVSSSLLIAAEWGLAPAPAAARADPASLHPPAPAVAPSRPDVAEVIARALKGAGLVR